MDGRQRGGHGPEMGNKEKEKGKEIGVRTTE